LMRLAFFALCVLLTSSAATAQLALTPANPSPIDTVRLRYTHTGCTNADSVRVAQQSNRITVQADRIFFPDCGTVVGYFEDFTLGRLPSGEYDAQLVVNPPPGTLGPSQLLGPIHFTVSELPPTGAASPRENYADMWWNPQESGWALLITQSAEKLIFVWVVYDAEGKPTWYTLQAGNWARDENNALHFAGAVYRTSGPYWGGTYDATAVAVTAVGTGDFLPRGVSRAIFSYTIQGVTRSKAIERFPF
jgi:hypothetical protein